MYGIRVCRWFDMDCTIAWRWTYPSRVTRISVRHCRTDNRPGCVRSARAMRVTGKRRNSKCESLVDEAERSRDNCSSMCFLHCQWWTNNVIQCSDIVVSNGLKCIRKHHPNDDCAGRNLKAIEPLFLETNSHLELHHLPSKMHGSSFMPMCR